MPTILEPISFDLAVKDCNQKYRFICVARGDNRHLWDCLAAVAPPQSPLIRGEQDGGELSIVIAIGPEGGWTEGEVKRAIEFDFEAVSLGRRILRAVTAPMVALSLVGVAFEKC